MPSHNSVKESSVFPGLCEFHVDLDVSLVPPRLILGVILQYSIVQCLGRIGKGAKTDLT